MVWGLSVWILCLLLISSAACYPATKRDYVYPYKSVMDSGGAAAGIPNPRSKDFRSVVSKLSDQSAQDQLPKTDLQQTSHPTADQIPFWVAAPRVSILPQSSGSKRFSETFDSRSDKSSSYAQPRSHSLDYKKAAVKMARTDPVFSIDVDPDLSLDEKEASPDRETSPFHPPAVAENIFWLSYGPFPFASVHGFGGHGSVPYENPSTAALPWDKEPAGDYVLFYDPRNWVASPVLSLWDSNVKVHQSVSEMVPLPPSYSHAVNWFQKAEEAPHSRHGHNQPPSLPSLPQQQAGFYQGAGPEGWV